MTDLTKQLLRNWLLLTGGIAFIVAICFVDYYYTEFRGVLFLMGIMLGVWLSFSMYCFVMRHSIKD